MSKASRGLAASAEDNKLGPNYFGFCTHEVADLFSQDDDFLPFSSQSSELSGEVRDMDVNEYSNNEIKANGFTSSSPLFSNGIGAKLSDFRKERLNGLLRQSVVILTQEVDEGSGSEHRNSKLTLSEKRVVQRKCAHCHTTKNPMWRTDPEGPRSLCNACGIKLTKERESLSTKNEERESRLGSGIGAGKENEVSDDLQFLLENDSLQVEEIMRKYSDELSATLGNMEQQLEELLDTVTAKCRPMTLTEKQKLRNLIQNLPSKNLDRVVEIIRRGKMSETHSHDEIHVDLEEEDNLTLWRLYYYVKAVENARKLSMSLNLNKALL